MAEATPFVNRRLQISETPFVTPANRHRSQIEQINMKLERSEENCNPEEITTEFTNLLDQMSLEYDAEANRLQKILEGIGFTDDDLSEEGKMMLACLVDYAQNTGLEKVDSTSIVLETSKRTVEDAELTLKVTSLERENVLLEKKNKKLDEEIADLLRELATVKEETSEMEAANEIKKNEISAMNSEIKNLKRDINELEHSLDDRIDNNINHQTVAELYEKLSLTKGDAVMITKKLEKYMGLPPDIELAQMKVNELKEELRILQQKYVTVFQE